MDIIEQRGTGAECVYMYWQPSLEAGETWPCKIGKATNVKKRIMCVLSAMIENPKIVVFYTDNSFWLEQIAHSRMREMGRAINREWFMTNPSEFFDVVSAHQLDPNRAAPIGAQIRMLRQAAKISQVDLAKMSGSAQSSISDIENGNVAPMVDTVDKLARLMGHKLVIVPL